MKKSIFTLAMTLLLHTFALAQCSCYLVEDLSIVGQDSMELVMSNSCDDNVYLNLYVISTLAPFDTLGKQEVFGAFILPLNTNVPQILQTNLTTAPSPGTYKVSITNGTFSCDSIAFSQTLNTAEIPKENFNSVSPNPFNSATTLHFDNYINKASLLLYNYNGQLVKQIREVSGETFRLDLSDFASGIYFIHLRQGNKLIATDKLILKSN